MTEDKSIDINCDMGESYGRYQVGQDDMIFPLVSSCNLACGFHAGDPKTLIYSLTQAKKLNVRIGAHPSYPDLAGFGRRKMTVAPSELSAIIKYQVAAVWGLAKSVGTEIRYVKPHGALYNSISVDDEECKIVIEAILSIDQTLALMGLAGSKVVQVAKSMGIRFIPEAFGDRRYQPDGTLAPRSLPQSVLDTPKEIVDQVLNMVLSNQVKTTEGNYIQVFPESICLHGDHLNTVIALKELRKALKKHGFKIKA